MHRVWHRWMWPDATNQVSWKRSDDGVPLQTKYVFTKRASYEVRAIADVLYRAPLHPEPPQLNPAPINATVRYVLNDDWYGNF